MTFEIIDGDALGRIGKFSINSKKMITPNLFPVVHPYNNLFPPSDLKKIGAECLFTNSYILYNNQEKREKVLKTGIHNHLNFEGLIATDSGAFQQYMYNKDKLKISADIIEKFQEDIGSDFPVILDIPVQLDDDYNVAREKVNTTIERAKDNIKRRTNDKCHWFGPIHGAKHSDLLRKSATEMSNLDFSVSAIGGLVKAFLEYRFDVTIQILLTVKKYITPSRPIHMFGLGLPQFFSLAVACGCDLMDSAAYILFAKQNRYFTLSTGTKKLEQLEEFPCHCPICCKYSPKEVKKFDEKLRTEIIAKHNLYLSFSELKTVRQAIREGNLWELVEQRIRNHPSLVKAYNLVKENEEMFQPNEKIYKNHGRLFVSQESINRPIIKRYENRLIENYRPPKEAEFLIILPELDTSSQNSISINEWLNILNKNEIVPRKYLHITFLSDFYGIIPLGLSQTFPMGQYESIKSVKKNDLISQNSKEKALKYLKHNSNHYKYCGILIPNRYFNQFNEETEIKEENPIKVLINEVEQIFQNRITVSSEINDILNHIKVLNEK